MTDKFFYFVVTNYSEMDEYLWNPEPFVEIRPILVNEATKKYSKADFIIELTYRLRKDSKIDNFSITINKNKNLRRRDGSYNFKSSLVVKLLTKEGIEELPNCLAYGDYKENTIFLANFKEFCYYILSFKKKANIENIMYLLHNYLVEK